MPQKITMKKLRYAKRRAERAKLDERIDYWRGKMYSSTTEAKREEARMKMIEYQFKKQKLPLRSRKSRSSS